MDMQNIAWLKPAIWGAVGGAAAFAIVAFSAGWIVTNNTAQDMADRQTEKAVIASLTPICVAKFNSEPMAGKSTHLAKLEDTNNWERDDYIADHGWATFAGAKEANDEVATACATELLKVAEK